MPASTSSAGTPTVEATETASRTGTPAATASVKTRVLRLDPWKDKTALKHAVTVRFRSGSCMGSALTGRKDAFRCALDNGLLDPCFAKPGSNGRSLMCLTGGRKPWARADGVRNVTRDQSGPSAPVWLHLANGAQCLPASGAGPKGLPRFPYWAGYCLGGPYRDSKTWRATEDDGKNALYPLLSDHKGGWLAAVEQTPGKVTLVPVARAYR
ncbi:hypothetical protein [Nigerium massiliense]|uniref:hypothetical protein n=1 Tax=Nigerium massiliense TaxID=1522317 RepID=UPI00058D8D40|nr:hypothetical protein [Nigerium massiliense]